VRRNRVILAAVCASSVALAGRGGWGVALAALGAPTLKWQYGGCSAGPYCDTGWYSSPAVADLDNDGQPEVIWGGYDVVALNGSTGAVKWTGASGNRVWPGIAVADLNGDGLLEVVVGRNSDQLTVYDRTGAVMWTRNPFGSGEVRTLAVADLETDGQLEVVVGRGSGGDTQQLNVYEPNGSVRPGWPARHAGDLGYGWGMYNENVAVADMNGDGFKEIFGPTDTHYITALDRNGNQLPVNPVYTGRSVWSQVGVHVDHAVDLRGYAMCGTEHRPNFADSAPVVADVNGDGIPELIVVGNVYNCGADPYASLYQMPFILKLDRTRWSGSGFDWTAIPPDPGPTGRPLSEDYSVIENVVPNPAVADLDGDGFAEIVYPSYDGKMHAYWLDKNQHGSWPYTIPTAGLGGDTFRFASEPVIADLDNDGHAEVIFTSWPKKATGGVGQLHVLDYLGHELYRVNLPAPSIGEAYNGGLGAPTLANIDADPDLEVVVGTVSSGVVAYDLPGTAGARILWNTGRGSFHRSGRIPSAVRRAPNFDGDLKADAVVYHPPTGLWYARQSSTGTTFSVGYGGPGYQPVPGDYDGDGKTDAAVYQTSSGLWFVRQSSTGTTFTMGFGGAGFVPVPRDYDGDGRTDLAVYHAASGLWYVRNSGSASVWSTTFGGNGYDPVAADYDGDGRADLAVYQSSSGYWSIRPSAGAGTMTLAFGGSGFTPLPRDYDGDGRADLAVYHAATGLWYVRQSSAGNTVTAGFGGPGYVAVPADFDGDRRADLAVYHAASGLWFVRQSTTGATASFAFGGSTFTPVAE